MSSFMVVFVLSLSVGLLLLWRKDQDWWRSKVSFIRLSSMLPFDKMVNDSYLKCKDGTLVAVLELKAFDYALCTSGKIAELEKHRLNWLNNMAEENARIRLFTFRDEVDCKSTGKFPNSILTKLNDVWMNGFNGAYINRHYAVVSISPKKIAIKKIMPTVSKLNRLVEITKDLLFDFQPNLLKQAKHSPILSFWSRVSIFQDVPVANGKQINERIATSELLFRKDNTIVADNKYVKAISINTWGDSCERKVMDEILRLDSEMIVFHNLQGQSKIQSTMNGFNAIGYQAEGVKTWKGEGEEYDEYQGVLYGIKSGEATLYEYQLTIFVTNKDLAKCEHIINKIKKILNQEGINPIIAAKTLKWLYLSMLPSNEDLIYPARLLSILIAHWITIAGEATGFNKSDWADECIRVFKTVNGGLYKHQYHAIPGKATVAHGLMIAPTGKGKTALNNFLATGAFRHGVCMYIFDRDNASRIFTKACGGVCVDLNNTLNPFFCDDTQEDRDFLLNLVLMMADCSDEVSRNDARVAIDNILGVPKEKRILTNLFKHGIKNGKFKKGLEFWVGNNPYAYWFNGVDANGNAFDALDVSSNNHLVTFDMTAIQETSVVAASVQYYIMYRIRKELKKNARPHIVFIDEAKPQLENPQFCKHVSKMLLEHRRLRGSVMPCFQNVGSLVNNPISAIMIESAETKYIFQNPAAEIEDYAPLKLTEYEKAYVKGDLTVCNQFKHSVLVKRKGESVILDIDLTRIGKLIRIFYGDRDSLNLANDLEAQYKGTDTCWVNEYLAR